MAKQPQVVPTGLREYACSLYFKEKQDDAVENYSSITF